MFAIALLAWNCAGQVAPQGGPVDSEPPTIIETYPTAKTVGYHDNFIRLSFSEWVDKPSIFESIFISPSLGELEFNWSGTDVEITFSDTLRDSTTYVLTLGTDVTDLHNVKMAESFSLAFSTGSHIDSGAIAGVIYDEKPQGIMVFAYMLDGRNGDTLNPKSCKPDYLTQTGKEGTFYMPYLRLGNYRLIAVRDEFKNLVYDPQSDKFGIPQNEFTLTPEQNLIQGVTIQMTAEDTSAPFLSGARGIDLQHVMLRFSEKIDTASLRTENIVIVDTVTNGRLTVINASPSDTSLLEAILLTGEQDSMKTYRAAISGIRDIYGNTLSTLSKAVEFDGAKTPDTTKPYLSFLNLTADSRNVFPDDSIFIGVNEWIIDRPVSNAIVLTDSGKNVIGTTFKWINATHAVFFPQQPLMFAMPYTISIRLDSLIDVVGNHYSDSTRLLKFQTVDKERLGNLLGEIIDEKKTTSGAIFIKAEPLSKEQRGSVQRLNQPGTFSFENLQEGKYIITAFIDSDSNNVYTYGTLHPFSTSERFVFHTDTLKIRARWNTEGVTVRFR